jgi:hypothetical protein
MFKRLHTTIRYKWNAMSLFLHINNQQDLKIPPQRLEDVITNCANIVSLVEDPVIGLMQSNGRKPFKGNEIFE